MLAVFLGAAIGVEREFSRKDAGLRTYTLVTLGATLFTLISVYGFSNVPGGQGVDVSRVAAQIVVGIGFLGAGLIFLKGNHVRGLTTAAGLWMVSAIGMAVGLGLYEMAIATTIVALIVLVVLRFIEDRLIRNNTDGTEQ